MGTRYGRAQFLRDAIALGLPVREAFSRVALRRQRDRLMREHHPDRGGSDERAREINDTYARMIRWLDERQKSPTRSSDENPPVRVEGDDAIEEPASAKILKKAAAVAIWAVTLAASSYIAARKSRRR